jgi:hypothetical protein
MFAHPPPRPLPVDSPLLMVPDLWRAGEVLDVCGWCAGPLVLIAGRHQLGAPNPFWCPRCDGTHPAHAIAGDGIRAAS